MNKFIPFGVQYYRAPTPDRTDWAKDLKNIKEHGFNTVKIFVSWRWNHPSPEKYYFDDIDELISLARKNSLKVVFNTIFDCAPAWLYQKYPDCRMKTADGRYLGPTAYACRQTGGAPGPCLNHPEAVPLLLEFLSETVRRYHRHPALYAWDVWNEPEITSSLLRDVGWGRNGETRDLVCYCENCVNAFLESLRRKYRIITNLNRSWNRNYLRWDEIEIPVLGHTFQDMIDWRLFFVDTMSSHLAKRVETVKRYDRNHPVMCHVVTMPYFNQVSCGSDEWKLGKQCDLLGNSLPVFDPFIVDITRSAVKGKKIWSSEIHVGGMTLYRPKLFSPDNLNRHIFGGLTQGTQGFLFWQFRPERLGLEAPGWGMTNLDGSSTPLLKSAQEVGKILAKNSQFLASVKPSQTDIAILFQPESQIFSWCSANTVSLHDKSLMGVYQALYDHNYSVDFIHPLEIEKGILSGYRVVYLPFPYYLKKEVCLALKDWVKEGGLLISEPFLAGIDTETGWHSPVVPGYGFDSVFQVDEESVLTFDFKTRVELKVRRRLPLLEKGTKVCGIHTRQSFKVGKAKVLCTFDDGSPAITLASYGKGQAVMIGTFPGYNYYENKDRNTGFLIASLVMLNTRTIPARVEPYEKVRVDLLKGKSEVWLVLQNNEGKEVDVRISLFPPEKCSFLKELFTGKKVALINIKGTPCFSTRLKPDATQVYGVV